MFSKSSKYAIRAAIYLATHSDEKNKLGVKALGEALKVPSHFLGKILQEMARQKLISSAKGPGGGFYLNDENRMVSLRQIVLGIEGPEIMEGCLLGFDECGAHNPCALHNIYGIYRNGLFNLLGDQTVEEVAERVKRKDGKI